MKNAFRVNQVTIVGLGLMGGSLGMAVIRAGLAGTVTGFARRPETRRLALGRGAVHEAPCRLDRAVRDADLVVFCTPLGCTAELVRKCIPFFKDSCTVTDVGSSKRELVARLDPLFKKGGSSFIGGHPIAGSELKGLDAARPDLYENAVVALTPTRRTNAGASDMVRDFWSALGARTLFCSPAEHDKLVARTSHLPHLVAAMLAFQTGRESVKNIRDLCGTGFSDTTRIADGDPGLWMEIIKSNAPAVSRELDAFERRVALVKQLIETGDYSGLRRFLQSGRTRRRKFSRR